MSRTSFYFWYKWLYLVSILNILAGLLIAFFANSFLFEFYNDLIADTFFGGAISSDAATFRNFIYGPLGGTISGYFILQLFILKFAFRNKETWSWYAIVIALAIWFVIDSAVSIMSGAYFNVLTINLLTILLHIIPLIATRKYFDHTKVNKDLLSFLNK